MDPDKKSLISVTQLSDSSDSLSASSNSPLVSSGPVLDAPFNGALQPVDPKSVDQGSLLDQVSTSMPDEEVPFAKRRFSRQRTLGFGLLVFGILAATFLGLRIESNKSKAQEASLAAPSARFQQQQVPLTTLNKQLGAAAQAGSAVTVNGQLQVTNSLVLQPSTETGPAVTGQMYYDANTNALAYYNGKQYVTLQGGGNTYITNNTAGNVTNVTNNTFITNNSGGGFGGTGTPGTLAMFASATTLGNSLVTESGTTLNVGSATGAATTNMQGGTGGVNISTGTVGGGESGGVSIMSGGSTAQGSGNVTIDNGVGTVNGTVIEDYTFETGTTGWSGTPYGTAITQSNAMAHGGSYSLAVPLTLSSWASAGSGSMPVTAGHEYHWSVWLRGDVGSATVSIVSYFENGGNTSPAATVVTDSTGAWTQVTGNFIDPAGTTQAQLAFVYEKNASGETHYIDDVTLTDLSGFDGTAINIGTSNAEAITVGNSDQLGLTTIRGGKGVTVDGGLGSLNESATTVAISSLDQVSIAAGTGNATITTAAGSGVTGAITVQSGDSSTTASGDVTVDTGQGFVSGTITSNLNFEDNTPDSVEAWFGDTVATTNTVAHGGTYSLAMTATGSFWGIILNGNSYVMPVTAGHHVVFSAWVRAATTPRSIAGNLDFNSTGLVATPVITDSTSGWTLITLSTVVPAGNTSATFRFDSSGAAVGETHYFDDITMTDLSSSSSSSTLHLGDTNAQGVNIGNMNELEATTIDGGSGITLNSGAGPFTLNGGSVTISGTAASSIGTQLGSLTLNSGGGTGGGVIVAPQSGSTTAFQVQGVNVNLLTVDSTDNEISLGTGAGTAFGTTGIGPNAGGGSGPDTMTAQKLTTTSGGIISSMSAYIGAWGIAAAPNNQYQFAIYADNGGAPGAYITSSAIGALGTTAGWYTLPISTTLAANTTYWLTYWQHDNHADSNNGFSYYYPVNGSVSISNQFTWQSGTDNGMPATFPVAGGVTTTGALASMYASYTSAGPALTIDQYGTLTQTGAALFQDPTDSTQALQVKDGLGNVLLAVDTADMNITVGGALIVTGDITVNGHIVSGGNTPSIAAGAAACTSPTVSVSGTDTSGTITVITGSGCSGSGALATITFAGAFGAAPRVSLTPGSSASSGLNVYVDDSSVATTGFSIGTGGTPANATVYKWNYIVIQ